MLEYTLWFLAQSFRTRARNLRLALHHPTRRLVHYPPPRWQPPANPSSPPHWMYQRAKAQERKLRRERKEAAHTLNRLLRQ